MAFAFTYKAPVSIGNANGGLWQIMGTATNGGSDTSGAITLGTTTTFTDKNLYFKNVVGSSFTNVTNSAAFKVVKTNSSGNDVLTLTCGSGDSFDFVIYAINDGKHSS